MSSLTFSRPPPLAPSLAPLPPAPLSPASDSSITPATTATTTGANETSSPPLSPAPPHLTLPPPQTYAIRGNAVAARIGRPPAEHEMPPWTKQTYARAGAGAGAGSVVGGGETPYNTPAGGVGGDGHVPLLQNAMQKLAAQAQSGGGGHTTAGGMGMMSVPSSLSSPAPPLQVGAGGAGVRPLNAAAAMRGRAIGISSGAQGQGQGHRSIAGSGAGNGSGNGMGADGHGHGHQGQGHPPTPGNTPSSLERISRRLANNLMVAPQPQAASNRIAPSYERRFDAGLHDLNPRSPQSTLNPRNAPDLLANATALAKADWPTHYSESEPDIAEGAESASERGRV